MSLTHNDNLMASVYHPICLSAIAFGLKVQLKIKIIGSCPEEGKQWGNVVFLRERYENR